MQTIKQQIQELESQIEQKNKQITDVAADRQKVMAMASRYSASLGGKLADKDKTAVPQAQPTTMADKEAKSAAKPKTAASQVLPSTKMDKQNIAAGTKPASSPTETEEEKADDQDRLKSINEALKNLFK